MNLFQGGFMSPTTKWVVGSLAAAYLSLLFWLYGVLSTAVARVENSNLEILKTVSALEAKMENVGQLRNDLQRLQDRVDGHIMNDRQRVRSSR
jgi:hypothetical protein